MMWLALPGRPYRVGMQYLAWVANPTVEAWVSTLRIMMLTYECWAIPFRLALMRRWHWADLSMDCIAVLWVVHGLVVAVRSDLELAAGGRCDGGARTLLPTVPSFTCYS